MNTNQKSRKIWKRPAFLIPCVVLLLILSVLSLLRFGNPQWHRYVYMFQAYVWPKRPMSWGFSRRPSGYTGPWTTWHSNGQKASEEYYKEGKANGKLILWYPDGQKGSECHYRDDELHGSYTIWFRDGRKWFEKHYANGKKYGKWSQWGDAGNVLFVNRYENGTLVQCEVLPNEAEDAKVAFWAGPVQNRIFAITSERCFFARPDTSSREESLTVHRLHVAGTLQDGHEVEILPWVSPGPISPDHTVYLSPKSRLGPGQLSEVWIDVDGNSRNLRHYQIPVGDFQTFLKTGELSRSEPRKQ